MIAHTPTVRQTGGNPDYVARRTAEGPSKGDIIRCLKRFPREVDRPPSPSRARRRRINELLDHRGVNSLAESFNGLYKWELIHRQGPWIGLEDVEFATMSYVDWFNHRRLHGAITNGPGYTTPARHEADHYRHNHPAEQLVTQ
jgi:hypothetical protein